jgi:hypothetical protein
VTRWDNLLTQANRSCFSMFGVPVIYTPSLETRMELGGIPITIEGVFDERRETVSLMGAGGLDAVVPRPVVEIQLAELGIEPMVGDEVTVGALSYRVQEVQPTGGGLAILVLVQQGDLFTGY